MAHFCGFIKLIFLLLILAQIPFRETRPIKSATSISNDDDLIVGSEFLQLFLERDRLQNELYNKGHFRPKNNTTNSRMNSSASNSSNNSSSKKTRTIRQPHDDVFLQEERSLSSRSLRDESSNSHQALESSLKQRHQHQHLEQQSAETRKKEKELIGANNNKQVIKLVTTGSKIVFLEDYDNDDAIIDAEARDIDLQKENPINKKQIIKTNTTRAATTKNLDDFKVVAVSVSTSTQHDRKPIPKIHDRLNHNSVIATDKKHLMTIANQSTATTGHTSSQSSPLSPSSPSSLLKSGKADVPGVDNFINRSIKEIESSSHNEHRTRRPVRILQRQYNINGQNGKLNGMDAENSASTNVKKVLVIPRSLNKNSYSTLRNVTTNNRNKINNRTTKSNKSDIAIVSGEAITVEDQLLPFETVIYHDSKESHGPQSRSISYSSISQNVQDLQKWQQTGVLAEARRNVSESLKAIARKSNSAPSLPLDQQQQQQQPIETPNRYSEPSIMYSVPAKFYSEPAKIYSEPSKVYGEQEKFYSEPAKNYGEPSKFYSEPSKVYSQPAKVYSEPAKTYWPPSAAPLTLNKANDGSSLPITAAASPSASSSTANRKPAIVSRIAFGEAQNLGTLSTTSTTIRPATTTIPIKTISTTINPPNTYKTQRNNDHSNNPNNRQRYYPSGSGGGNSSGNSSPTTIPRRILFNLDKLPYDLLNAPEPVNLQQQHHHHQQQQQQQQQQEQHSPINPCLDAAVSSLFSTSSLSAHLDDQQQQSQHPQQQQQQQQHHSTQNTKGLLKEDLVKCVAEISHTTSTSTSTSTPSYTLTFFTTERTQNDDYYAPTPEQNYETEEAVSVMTNGRAHGIQKDNTKFNNSRGNSKNDGVAVTATTSSAAANSHNFKPMRQRVRFGTNIKAVNDAYDDDNSDATIARSRATITHNHQQHQNHNEHVTGSGRRGHLTHAQSHDNNSNAKINVAHNNNPLIQAHHNDDSVVVVNHNLGIPSENYDDYVVDIIEESAGDDDGAIFKTNPNYPTAVSAPHHHIGASNSDGGGVGQLANVPHNLNDDNDDDDGNTNGDDDAKVAYVVEGRNYRKYRVEEKTDDGFIVGEYGVVNHNDGNLRGVRYTADSTINRSLIQKALLTFLKLK